MAKGNPTAGILLLLLASVIVGYGLPGASKLFGNAPKSIIDEYMKDNGLDTPPDPKDPNNRSGGNANEVPGTQLPPGTVPPGAKLDLGFVGEKGATAVG